MRYSVKLDQIVMEFRLEFHHCYMLVGFKGLGFMSLQADILGKDFQGVLLDDSNGLAIGTIKA